MSSALEILPKNSDYISVSLLWWLPLSEIWRSGEKCFPSGISREPLATFGSRLCTIHYLWFTVSTLFFLESLFSIYILTSSTYYVLLCPSRVCFHAAPLHVELRSSVSSRSRGSESFKSNIVGQEPAVPREDCSTGVTLPGEMGPEKL